MVKPTYCHKLSSQPQKKNPGDEMLNLSASCIDENKSVLSTLLCHLLFCFALLFVYTFNYNKCVDM